MKEDNEHEGGAKAASAVMGLCSCLCALACLSIPITSMVIILGTWDDVTDPMRHATIKDFQTRLEHLSALKSTNLSSLSFDRAHLNLNILRSTPDSLQLSYKLKTPR